MLFFSCYRSLSDKEWNNWKGVSKLIRGWLQTLTAREKQYLKAYHGGFMKKQNHICTKRCQKWFFCPVILLCVGMSNFMLSSLHYSDFHAQVQHRLLSITILACLIFSTYIIYFKQRKPVVFMIYIFCPNLSRD